MVLTFFAQKPHVLGPIVDGESIGLGHQLSDVESQPRAFYLRIRPTHCPGEYTLLLILWHQQPVRRNIDGHLAVMVVVHPDSDLLAAV